jgi:hypothetical protein
MIRSVLASAILLTAAIAMPSAQAQRTANIRPQAAKDLAAEVAGTYVGDVISDARGSSQSGVVITVTRVGPNQVQVSANYPRIPTVRITLEAALNSIVQAGGDHVFVIDRDRDPRALSLTIDDASLNVRRK